MREHFRPQKHIQSQNINEKQDMRSPKNALKAKGSIQTEPLPKSSL
jgi:hypothetical protein